ncbi:MAG: DUF362 domain-containing protein [Dehalococcoidia bacterium]|nr:DUF362 domain-containing protein [Dehalococcoidia bacterium]
MTNRVAITRVGTGGVDEAVRQAVALAGGFDELINGSSRVLVKPNQCKPSPRHSGCQADGDVVEAVTKLVLERNPKSVVIGDGAIAGYDFGGFSTQESFDSSGVTEVANRLGVELRNLNAEGFEEVKVPGALVMESVRIAKTVLESDVIISIPVLKTHIRTHATLSLKNMKGAMPGPEKRKSHRLGLDQAIVDLCSVVKPHYAVIDATVGMQGLWQYPEDTREMGLIVAGSDALYTDVVGAALMDIDPAIIMHLQYLAEKEGKKASLEAIDMVGEPLQDNKKHFMVGFDVFKSRYPDVNIVQGESACSGCTNELVSAITYMKQAGFEEHMKGLTVVIGNAPEVDVSGRVVALGKCAAGLKGATAHLPGCPPKEEAMIRTLCEVCGTDAEVVMATMANARKRLWDDSSSALER